MDVQRLKKVMPGAAARVGRIARPESVLLLAETVRAALDVRDERIAPLKAQVTTDAAYMIPTKDLAARLLNGTKR
jgi:hypothetical protein